MTEEKTPKKNNQKVELTLRYESENGEMKSIQAICNVDISSEFCLKFNAIIQVDRNEGSASLHTEVCPMGGTEPTLEVRAIPEGEQFQVVKEDRRTACKLCLKCQDEAGSVRSSQMEEEYVILPKDVPPDEKPSQGKICVASRNKNYAQIVCRKLNNTVLKAYFDAHMEVCPKKIKSDYQSSISNSFKALFNSENFDGAHLVMFVATAEPRMLLVSKNEESQLGVIYQQACDRKCSVFLLIVGHSDSDNLSDTELYHKDSLDEVIDDQPALKELRDQGQLASLGYCYNPDELEFNTKQSDAIIQWIDKRSESSMKP